MTIYSLDILLPDLKPACCSISSSNCCFLTCIQISQEAGQEVWYSHLFKNFPEFAVIHSPLPEKFIFILKDNRNSLFFFFFTLFTFSFVCSSGILYASIHLNSSSCYGCLHICSSVLLGSAMNTEILVKCLCNEYRGKWMVHFAGLWSDKKNCEELIKHQLLCWVWWQRFLTLWMNSNWKWLLMIYQSNWFLLFISFKFFSINLNTSSIIKHSLFALLLYDTACMVVNSLYP